VTPPEKEGKRGKNRPLLTHRGEGGHSTRWKKGRRGKGISSGIKIQKKIGPPPLNWRQKCPCMIPLAGEGSLAQLGKGGREENKAECISDLTLKERKGKRTLRIVLLSFTRHQAERGERKEGKREKSRVRSLRFLIHLEKKKKGKKGGRDPHSVIQCLDRERGGKE